MRISTLIATLALSYGLAQAQQHSYIQALPRIERHNFKKIPKGWERTQVTEGDLNKDALDDVAFVAISPTHIKVGTSCRQIYQTTANASRVAMPTTVDTIYIRTQILVVYLAQPNGSYERVVYNTHLFEDAQSYDRKSLDSNLNVSSGSMRQVSLSINNGCLDFEGLVNVSAFVSEIKQRYRWQQGAMRLIGSSRQSSYKGIDSGCDWNLSTGKWVSSHQGKVEKTGVKKLNPLPTLQAAKFLELMPED